MIDVEMLRRKVALVALTILLFASAGPASALAEDASPGIASAEFIYDKAPFRECHASTIEWTKGGLVAAWFGGTAEGHRDVGIWLSRHDGEKWSAPVEVANGVKADGTRHPCWNPVLFQMSGPLVLFYKVGPSPSTWWGMRMESSDNGKTWSKSVRIPDGLLGPVKNKPVLGRDGAILAGSSTEHDGWRLHMERSTDGGKTFTKIGPLNDGKEFGAIQPTILIWPGGELQILCRSRQNKIVESRSSDGGKTWSTVKAIALPNPSSGIDAVTLRDGRGLLVYNHTTRNSASRPRDREFLNVAVSADGKKWAAAAVLENQPGEYSYPAAIQTPDGLVHITYTYDRKRIKHVVLDPAKLNVRDFAADGSWPADVK
jgi:predicted neuraminidase